ncbi:hypothetical protein Q3G72_015071 [Acer saccharum]|nr:hypothetical protein Q3G72_015071 [Acer saccharum]
MATTKMILFLLNQVLLLVIICKRYILDPLNYAIDRDCCHHLWNPIYRYTFKHKLSLRYGEDLPGIDIFFQVEPRSPQAYFHTPPLDRHHHHHQWQSIKKSYEEMKHRIETATELGQISEEIRGEHKGFHEWDSVSSRRDHQTILQILIDGRDCEAVDIEGQPLPTLVYLAREKRPQFHHNFKAGAMNALIRVSSRISNGYIILNSFCNPTKNDIYGNNLSVLQEVELAGLDSNGGPSYIVAPMKRTLSGEKRWV